MTHGCTAAGVSASVKAMTPDERPPATCQAVDCRIQRSALPWIGGLCHQHGEVIGHANATLADSEAVA